MNKKLLRFTVDVIIIFVLTLILFAVLAPHADAGKYPPSVQAIVKLRNATSGLQNAETPRSIQKWRIKRNFRNAFAKNRKCTQCTTHLNKALMYSTVKDWSAVRRHLNKAKNLAWKYRAATK